MERHHGKAPLKESAKDVTKEIAADPKTMEVPYFRPNSAPA